MITSLEDCQQFTRELLTMKQVHIIGCTHVCRKKIGELEVLKRQCKIAQAGTRYCQEHWQITLDLSMEVLLAKGL